MGFFGVSKHEWENGVEVHRLIMNLIPVNQVCRGINGDVATLPSLSGMTPLFLGKDEQLVVSSEDVRCFFYIFKIPREWRRFMAFNKPLPSSLWPSGGTSRRYYLCSRVLPMGFKNSVSIAQNIHRNLIQWAGLRGGMLGDSSSELRKDRPFSFANPLVRVYLDNYDQLCKVDGKTAALVRGAPTVETLSLRAKYESWGIPNHPKKSVVRQPVAEVQGAILDGVEGIAFPKKDKVLKYTHLAYLLLRQGRASLKQIQGSWGRAGLSGDVSKTPPRLPEWNLDFPDRAGKIPSGYILGITTAGINGAGSLYLVDPFELHGLSLELGRDGHSIGRFYLWGRGHSLLRVD